MILAVVGSRSINDEGVIFRQLDSLLSFNSDIELVVTGGAKGVETIAAGWEKLNSIEVKVIRPDYSSHPPRIAPLIRNREIVNCSDYIIAIWDGKSRGTKYVINYAKKVGKIVKIFLVE